MERSRRILRPALKENCARLSLAAVGAVNEQVVSALPPGFFNDLVAEGLIEGVGSVIVFPPQILLLFFFIGVMEDSGYMAQVAFLMDRLMKSIGLLGAFAAREVFVSTMGVVYGIGEDVDEESVGLRQRIKREAHADGRPVYTPLVGLALMVFFAIACQCMSTLAVVRRETRSWTWPTFLFVYTGALAWLLSFAAFQGGRLLGFG